jgi:threonine/homoserine/homoserine lactone efflux protein
LINYLIIGITYSFACVVQPGPFQAFLFSQSLSKGWRKTIPLVFAPLISDIPVVLLVLLLLTKIPDQSLRIIQIFGGLFLLFLAYNAYKTWRTFGQTTEKNTPVHKNLLKAVVVNLLNPNPYLGWSLVMGPLLIKGWSENKVNGVVLLISFYCSMFIYSSLMVMLFGTARKLGSKANRILLGISVIALALFGIYELWSGLRILIS